MNYREKAEELFSWALQQPRASVSWQAHSRDVARVCEKIAEEAGMDKDLAYAKGLLHDFYKAIERDNEVFVEIDGDKVQALTHPFTGYRLLMEKGFPEAARAALTHTFYNIYEVLDGGFDLRLVPDDLTFLKKWVAENEFDDYDKLTQLVDNMVGWKGVMTIDDRFCDILTRHPVSNPQASLRKLYELKDYFDEKIKGNIYELFRDEICRTAITEPTRKPHVKKVA